MICSYLFILRWTSSITVRPLLFFGGVSDALFLRHQNIGYIVIHNLSKDDYDANLSITFALLVSSSLATLMTYLFEKPVSRATRLRYHALRSQYLKRLDIQHNEMSPEKCEKMKDLKVTDS